MKGTEKQVAWATDILDRVNPVFDVAIAKCDEEARPSIEDIKNRVNNADASVIITALKDICFVGDDCENWAHLRSVIRVYQKCISKQENMPRF